MQCLYCCCLDAKSYVEILAGQNRSIVADEDLAELPRDHVLDAPAADHRHEHARGRWHACEPHGRDAARLPHRRGGGPAHAGRVEQLGRAWPEYAENWNEDVNALQRKGGKAKGKGKTKGKGGKDRKRKGVGTMGG